MHLLTRVNISNPCNAAWNKMSQKSDGRYCDSCQKTVVEFSKMTDNQIVEYLNASTHVCGRFYSGQLEKLNRSIYTETLGKTSVWKSVLFFITLAVALPNKSKALNKANSVQTDKRNAAKHLSMQADTATLRIVTGKVTDAEDKLGLPGVAIRLNGTNKGTLTNAEGAFTMQVPVNGAELDFNYIGYETQIIKLSPGRSTINLQMVAMKGALMGEVVVVRAPFYKRWYYRFIKRPFKSIFD